MVDKAKVLEELNFIREVRGMKPLDAIPDAKPNVGLSEGCPIAMATGGTMGLTLLCLRGRKGIRKLEERYGKTNVFFFNKSEYTIDVGDTILYDFRTEWDAEYYGR